MYLYRLTPLLLAFVAVPVVGLTTSVHAAGADGLIDVIVSFEPSANVDATAPDSPIAGMDVEHVYEDVLDGAAVSVTPEQLAELQADPDVAAIAPDGRVHIAASTSLWNLDRIDQMSLPLSGTYSPTTTGTGVRVYVVDTGVNASHSQFSGRIATGYTAIDDAVGTGDCHGHGTHVAGTIAGSTYGVAPGATIVPVRVLDCDGWGSTSNIIAALEYIRNEPISGVPRVVNMSLGMVGRDLFFEQAVTNLVNSGVPVVVAAGNSNADACGTSPAAAPQAITVGAITSADQRASFSNWGSCVDLFAPGVGILSASYLGGSTYMDGTSMASPHVAGAIALFAQGSTSAVSAAAEVLNRVAVGQVGNLNSSPNKLLYVGPVEMLSITSIGLPPAMKNQNYYAALQADGTGPFSWQLVSGKFPKGLWMSTSGVISGRMSATKGSTVTVRVVSGGGASTTRQFEISVAPALKVRTARLLPGSVGAPYSVSLSASGGTGPFTWTVGGTLPSGLSLSADGSLSGVPDVPGKLRLTAVVTDAFGYTATKSLTLTIK